MSLPILATLLIPVLSVHSLVSTLAETFVEFMFDDAHN